MPTRHIHNGVVYDEGGWQYRQQQRRRWTSAIRADWYWYVAWALLLVLSNPTKDSFIAQNETRETYYTLAGQAWSKLRSLWDSATLELHNYGLWSTIKLSSGKKYVGILGWWMELPELPRGGITSVSGSVSLLPILVGINVSVFAAWLVPDWSGTLHKHFTLTYSSAVKRPWTVLTACFSHNHWLHLLGNLSTLTSIGPVAVALLGWEKTLLLYLAGGVVAMTVSLAFRRATGVPYVELLGASGAIYSLIGFVLAVQPNIELLVFFGISLPAREAILFSFVQDVLAVPGMSHTRIDGVAHLAGAVFGYYMKDYLLK